MEQVRPLREFWPSSRIIAVIAAANKSRRGVAERPPVLSQLRATNLAQVVPAVVPLLLLQLGQAPQRPELSPTSSLILSGVAIAFLLAIKLRFCR